MERLGSRDVAASYAYLICFFLKYEHYEHVNMCGSKCTPHNISVGYRVQSLRESLHVKTS